MDVFNDKKKTDEKKPFFLEVDEKPFTNDVPKDNQNRSNKENSGYCPPIKDTVDNTEKQIDALFFRKQNSTDEVINYQKVTPESAKVEKVSQQKFERNLNQLNNETFSVPKGNIVPSAIPKNESTFNVLQSPTSLEDKQNQKSIKPHSLPKIRVHINKDRLNHIEARRNEHQSSVDIKTSDNTECFEETFKPNGTPKNEAVSPKKWLTSDIDNMSNHEKTTTDMPPFQQNTSSSFAKENNTKNISFTEKLKENHENKSVNVDHVPFVQQEPPLDEEVKKILAITNELLGKLPEEVIAEFSLSDDFVLYEKIMNKYHIK